MTEVMDKIITMESLALVHAYNQKAYMPKTENILVLVDIYESFSQYNLNELSGIMIETSDDDGIKQITLTNKIVNSTDSSIKFRSLQADENGDIVLYEVYFYLKNDEYSIIPTLTRYDIFAGERHSSLFSYTKLYGVKTV